MRRNPTNGPSSERRRKTEQPEKRVESDRCSFRNIMPKAQQRVKALALADSLRAVQFDAMSTINTRWFTDRLEQRGMSQRGLAKLMGIDSAAVSLMFRGKRRMSLDEAAQLAVLLQSSTQEVLEAAGVPVTSQRQVPIIGHMNGESTVGLEPEGTHEMVDAPPHLPANAVAIQARTARTGRDIYDGWLFFMGQEQGPPERAVGTYSLVAIKNSGLTMMQVQRGYRRGTYNLSDSAGRTIQNAEVAWASPVLWIKTTA